MAVWRPTWQEIITEHSVETWQDWPWDTWLGPYVVISPRRYRARVRVYRAGEWVDITSRVASGVIRESNDQPVATLELRLLEGGRIAPGPMTVPSLTTMRAEHEVPALPMRDAGALPSIAPRRKDSPLNRVNGQYVPLLWIGRPIAVEAAFSEDGSEPDEWWPVFLGELEDEIDTESGPDGTYVRLFCRDMATRLQRAYIAGPWTFENMYASQMIQAILDRAYTEGLIQEPVQLRLIGPDDFWVERYDIEYTDLWSALQRFCQQRGTDLRYRLNEQTGQIELTYWLPDRAMVPAWIIDGAQIRREELRISGTDIINRVTVRYRDAQTGRRAEVMVQDADSIAMYGLRHGLIEEPDTDLIPDEETAWKLAQTIVEDLKDVPALTRITCPFDPRIQLFDKLRVANPSVRDEPEDYAIEGRELQFSATDWSMVLIGAGRVVVKREAWLDKLAKEGVKAPIRGVELKPNDIPGDRLAESSVTTFHIARGALSALEVIQVFDDTGASTTDYESYVDIPGFAHTFTLDSEAVAVIIMRISGFLYDNTEPLDEPQRLKGLYYLNLNGARVRGQALEASHVVGKPDVPGYHRSFWASAVVTHATALSPGIHTVKGQFKVDDTVQNTVVFAYHRELSIIIFKKAEVNITEE